MSTTGNFGTAEWQALDREHHLHPFSDHKALHKQGSRIITRANGVYLWDSDENRILDGMSGLWCVNIGYGREELANAAQEQMLALPYYNTFFQTAHPPSIELSRLLAELTPDGLNHAFFVGSGSECNDTIVRLVRHFWSTQGKPERHVIISRENAYHGSTMASASLGGMQPMHAQGGLPIPGIEHITQPYWYRLGRDLSPADYGLEAARALEECILDVGPENVAAFVGEPVQGAGGVIVPPETYWPEINRICAKYDVLLVADEVICGFGRTGQWFGSNTFDIKADVMCLAKGLSSGYFPIGAVMVNDRIADGIINSGEFQHGFTYSGHPVGCAVAIENIRILRDERMIETVAEQTSPYFQEKLSQLENHPLVGQVRGVGLLGAIELVQDKNTRRRFSPEGDMGGICRDHALRAGLVMRAVKDSMVLSPPLSISQGEIDELFTMVQEALNLTARKPAS